MRLLILSLIALPNFAFAENPPAPQKAAAARVCWFSKKIGEHQAIMRKGCAEKLCNHQIACGSKQGYGTFAEQVVLKAKNGSCDGYTADEALALANSVVTETDFLTAPAPAAK